MIGAPALLLFTTGRHSGLRRGAALVYGRDGGRIVLAASNDGLDRPPSWFHNLRASPSVELQIGRLHLQAGGGHRTLQSGVPAPVGDYERHEPPPLRLLPGEDFQTDSRSGRYPGPAQ